MSIINVDNVNFDGKWIKPVTDFIKNFFAQQPKWLRNLLIAAVIGWCSYYLYNYVNDQRSINELQDEIIVIKEKMNGILSVEMYQENLIYVITEIQLLQQEETQSYNDELLEIDLSIQFIKRYHPNDQTIHDLEAMKQRLIVNHETYMQHYEHVMRLLMKTATDTL